MFEVPLFDVRIGEEEVEAVADAYRSGWLSSGPATEELESRFAAYTGAPHAVAVSSGTAALHLAMLVAGVAAEDRVAMPSMSFVATANAATYAGARPRFAEIAGVTRPWLSTEAAAEALDLGCSALATVRCRSPTSRPSCGSARRSSDGSPDGRAGYANRSR